MPELGAETCSDMGGYPFSLAQGRTRRLDASVSMFELGARTKQLAKLETIVHLAENRLTSREGVPCLLGPTLMVEQTAQAAENDPSGRRM